MSMKKFGAKPPSNNKILLDSVTSLKHIELEGVALCCSRIASSGLQFSSFLIVGSMLTFYVFILRSSPFIQDIFAAVSKKFLENFFQ